MSKPRLQLLAIAALAALLCILAPAPASAAINPWISFQGKLTNTDGTNVTDGNYSIRFRIYTDPSADTGSCANTCKWEETHSTVTVNGGLFHVNLGSGGSTLPGSVDFNGSALYLGIKVASDAEMTPRVRLTAAPYAFNSDTLDGMDSAALGQLATNQTWTGTNIFQPTANITSQIVKQTSSGSATADIFNVQTANATNIIQISGPAVNEAAVTISSVGASRALTLNSGSGTLVLGASTLQRTASGNTTINLIDSSDTTLSLTNTGTGVANINIDGNYQIAGAPGATAACSGGQFLQNQVVTGGITTNGTCASAGGASDLDGAYDNDGDKILTVDSATGLFLDLVTTGDLVVRDGTTAFATFDNSGGITLQPNGTSDLTFGGDDDSAFIQNGVVTSSGHLQDLNLTLGADADVDTVSALNIDVTSAATGDADVLYGLNIGNLASADGTVLERALRIGSGWDEVLDINGVLLSATELGRLDTKNANLVDENDLTSADGAGATSSGSGLEAGTGGIGLLQGCADNEVLKWNEAGAIWECGSDRLTYATVLSGDYTNATTTFTDVDDNATGNSDMGFAVGANEQWIFQMNLQTSFNITADSKWQITAPSGATCDVTLNDLESANAAFLSACGTSTGLFAIAATDTAGHFMVVGYVTTGGTAGTFQLQHGQNTASGTNTIFAGSMLRAYKISGADLAEVYYTEDKEVRPGSLVSLDPAFEAGVKKPLTPYDPKLLGIISTRPGSVLGDEQPQGRGSPVMVALTGRVPVRVSPENGPIEPGDYLTSSSIPGVAMKATRPGFVVAQALTGYAGENEGVVAGFIKPIWYSPPMVRGTDLQNGTLEGASIDKLHISGDLVVGGDAHFQGSVSVKDVVITGHVIVSPDTTGSLVIPAGQTSAQVRFRRPYAEVPKITTGVSDYVVVRVEDKSTYGFRIGIPAAQLQDITVDWTAFAVN